MAFKSVKALGTMVLVELLSAKEMLGTSIYVGENVEDKETTPQAYVRGWAPSFDNVKWGIELNDRVLVTGNYVPTGVVGEKDRKLVLVEFTSLKGVLV